MVRERNLTVSWLHTMVFFSLNFFSAKPILSVSLNIS